MKTLARSFVVLPLVLAACRSDSTQPASAAPQAATHRRIPSIMVQADARRLHDDVAWLADDAQEGRRAGTEAGKRCGDWIASRFTGLALQPAGEHGSFEQDFAVPLPTELGDASYVRFLDGNDRVVPGGREHVVPVFCSSSGVARGRLEWRGYGIIDADKSWNDYATRCDDKVVLIVRGTPPIQVESSTQPPADNVHGGNVQAGDGWGNDGSLFLKVMNAKRNGAVAVLIAPDPAHADEPLPAFDFGRAAQSGIPALFVSAEVADRLRAGWRDTFAALATNDAGDEHTDQRKLLEQRIAKFLAEQESVRSSGPQVEVDADIKREKGSAYNVLARLPGDRHDRVVVVGAHYDHLGRGGEGSLAPNSQGEIHNGADDNASGTATVLEMARLMKAAPQPPCDVVFALWSGEELGLLGSEYWVEHPTIPLDHVVANLNLDMVGRAGNGKLSVIGAGSSPPFEEWLRDAGAKAGLELQVSSSGQGIGGSDHQTFLKRKIPALHFFSGVHADYHKPSDDIERFEADGAAKVAVLGVDIVDRMCATGELAWTEPPAPTNDQPKMGAPFRVWFGTVPDYAFEGPGLRLTGTSAGSPAEKAGMLAGDVLVQVGDVKVENIQDFMYALQIYKPGDVVLSRFLRDGKEESVRVTLSTRDAQ